MEQRTNQLYLVVDPAVENIVRKTAEAIRGGVDIVQVWNHWPPGLDKKTFTQQIAAYSRVHKIPLMIHEDLDLMRECGAAGIHFDVLPSGLQRSDLGPGTFVGVTCGNDRNAIDRALAWGVDYISFCAMFPSASAVTCELVNPEIVKETRLKTPCLIFASGGVTPQNTGELMELGLNGVAVISGVTGTDSPEIAAREFKAAMHNKTKSLNK